MTGTLAYIPDASYGGKDEFTFKVHDGTVFSKDAKISIKNEKLSRNQVQQNDKQPTRERPNQSPTDQKKSTDDKSNNNNDTPPSDSSQQSSASGQDTEQQIKDQKGEQPQSSEPDKSTSNGDTAPNGDSPPSS